MESHPSQSLRHRPCPAVLPLTKARVTNQQEKKTPTHPPTPTWHGLSASSPPLSQMPDQARANNPPLTLKVSWLSNPPPAGVPDGSHPLPVSSRAKSAPRVTASGSGLIPVFWVGLLLAVLFLLSMAGLGHPPPHPPGSLSGLGGWRRGRPGDCRAGRRRGTRIGCNSPNWWSERDGGR